MSHCVKGAFHALPAQSIRCASDQHVGVQVLARLEEKLPLFCCHSIYATACQQTASGLLLGNATQHTPHLTLGVLRRHSSTPIGSLAASHTCGALKVHHAWPSCCWVGVLMYAVLAAALLCSAVCAVCCAAPFMRRKPPFACCSWIKGICVSYRCVLLAVCTVGLQSGPASETDALLQHAHAPTSVTLVCGSTRQSCACCCVECCCFVVCRPAFYNGCSICVFVHVVLGPGNAGSFAV